jgi:hypothetical protein
LPGELLRVAALRESGPSRRARSDVAAVDPRRNRSLRDDSLVRRVLGDPAAVCSWLAATLAGVVAAVVVGHAAWAVVGWVVGGVTAVVVVAVKARRGR